MDYMTISEAATKWNLSNRRIQTLCSQGRIPGAERAGYCWLLPKDAEKPVDARIKSGKYMSDVDDFDFICHVAFDKKPLTRKERANNVKKRDFLSKYSGVAREVLEALLDQYMNVGIYELEHEAILTTPQFAKFGKIQRIFKFFGGEDKYNEAVHELENELYEAG